jgi:asparagine synthase (glutamine-hydrolysing)
LSYIASKLDTNSEYNLIEEKIKNLILNYDGEYIVLFYNKTKDEIYLFNDVLGRLPLYYYVTDEIFVLSRHINFITHFLNEIVFDRDIIAEYLIFKAPLGKSTLISNINRLESGTLLEVRGNNKDLRFSKIYEFNLDKKEHAGKSIKENAAELKNLFLEGINNRYQSQGHSNILVSLSGGLDSRSVAAGLKKIGASFSAVTFTYNKQGYSFDAVIAKEISEKLQIPWKLIDIPKAGMKEVEKQLQYKCGLNNLGNSFGIKFFEIIEKEYGKNVSWWTGDIGETLVDDSPMKKLTNNDDVVDYIIESRLKIVKLEKYLDVNIQKLKNKLKHMVQQYPEEDFVNKYLHFIFFEESYKHSYEGEDVIRIFFWQVAPIFSIPFYNYTLNIPDNQKKHHKLYREFLRLLSPDIAMIKNSNWNKSFPSDQEIIFKEFKRWWINRIPFTIRKIIGNRIPIRKKTIEINPEIKNYITHILKTSPTISKNFLNSGFDRILNSKHESLEFWLFITVITLINKTEKEFNDRSVIII